MTPDEARRRYQASKRRTAQQHKGATTLKARTARRYHTALDFHERHPEASPEEVAHTAGLTLRGLKSLFYEKTGSTLLPKHKEH